MLPFLVRPAIGPNKVDLLMSLLATFVITIPLWFSRFAPLHDLPFHIARVFLLNDVLHDGVFSGFYEVNSFLLPNVGMDLLALALNQVLSIEYTCRLFLFMLVFITVSGVAFLHRTWFGTIGLAVPIAALLSYNAIFILGFLNYLLGVGILLWAVGIFLRMRSSRPVVVRLTIGLLLGLLLIFTHLVAFALYAIIVAGLELQAVFLLLRSDRRAALLRLVWSALPLVMVFGFFVAVSPTVNGGEARGGGGGFMMFDLSHKLWILKRSLAGGQNLLLDYSAITLAGLLVALLLVLTRARVAPGVWLALALLCITFLLAPDLLLGAGYLDLRLPVGIAFVAAGCVNFAAATSQMQTRLAVLVLSLVALRSAVLTRDWIRYDAVQQQFIETYACLPRGSILFVARPPPPEIGIWQGYWQPPIKHIASLASVTDGIFVPQTFAEPTQQPIRVRPEFQSIYAFQTPNPIGVETVAALEAKVDEIRKLVRQRQPDGTWPTYLMLLEPGRLDHPRLAAASIIIDYDLFSIFHIGAADDGTTASASTACSANQARTAHPALRGAAARRQQQERAEGD